MKVYKHAMHKMPVREVESRTKIQKSNIALRGEANRHKKVVSLKEIKFGK